MPLPKPAPIVAPATHHGLAVSSGIATIPTHPTRSSAIARISPIHRTTWLTVMVPSRPPRPIPPRTRPYTAGDSPPGPGDTR